MKQHLFQYLINGRKAFKAFISSLIVGCYSFSIVFFPLSEAYASEPFLPKPGVRINLSPPTKALTLNGLKVFSDNPQRMEFVIEKSDEGVSLDSEAFHGFLKSESQQLIKYFLAALTLQENEWWVNLSPYEKDRIITDDFGRTDLGRDLLAQDYMLKQVTASLLHPDSEYGKQFLTKSLFRDA